jgi:hypothetical protein
MIQVDDRVQAPARQGRAVAPADPGPPVLSRPEAEVPEGEEPIFFVSPPPAPFPRVLPGL